MNANGELMDSSRPNSVSTQDTPRPSSLHKGDLFTPEEQRACETKTGDEGEGKETRESEKGCLPQGRGYKGLPLDREWTGMAHRPVVVRASPR